MLRKITPLLTALVLVFTMSSQAFAASDGNGNASLKLGKIKEINSLEKLNIAIGSANNDGKITTSEANTILEMVSADTLKDYAAYVDDRALALLKSVEPSEVKYEKENDKSIETYRVKIDPLSSVELTLIDCKETGAGEGDAVNATKELSVSPLSESYATKGQTLWKEYGPRYYTAKYTRSLGTGKATICTENHYTISKGGITERKGVSWVDDMFAITGELDPNGTGYSLYSAAKNPGESTGIRARLGFKYQTNPGGVPVTSYKTLYENLFVKYIENAPSKKKMKVQYTWAATTV